MSQSAGVLAPMVRLAAPALLEQLLIMSVALVDQFLAGRFLAPEHLAANGLVWYVLWALPALFGMVATGTTALVARLVGGGKPRQASRVANQAMGVGALFAVVATAAVGLGATPFVQVMGLPHEAAELATRYLWIIVPTIPLMMVEQVGIAALRGAGDTFSGFVVMSLVNLINATVGAVLVTGAWGAPRLGWDGLAIGTAAGHAIGAVLVGGLLARGRAGLRLRWGAMTRTSRPILRRILRIGVPGGLDMLAIVGCHLWFLSVVNALGIAQAAAHAVAIRIESLAYLPGSAFQVAASTLVGQALGARDPRRARRAATACLAAGGGLMLAAAALFLLASRPLAALFLGADTQQIGELSARLLRIVACSQPALATLMILSGALHGAGDTRSVLKISFIGLVGVRIPLAYYLAWDELPWMAALDWGVVGAWYAMLIDLFVRGLLVLGRFLHGGWQWVRA